MYVAVRLPDCFCMPQTHRLQTVAWWAGGPGVAAGCLPASCLPHLAPHAQGPPAHSTYIIENVIIVTRTESSDNLSIDYGPSRCYRSLCDVHGIRCSIRLSSICVPWSTNGCYKLLPPEKQGSKKANTGSELHTSPHFFSEPVSMMHSPPPSWLVPPARGHPHLHSLRQPPCLPRACCPAAPGPTPWGAWTAHGRAARDQHSMPSTQGTVLALVVCIKYDELANMSGPSTA